ncbi:MAG: hypothetical protein HY342_06740 [Candidatus Lambdaproteobacteria bacterium]|nr:hypothetical protein [Candidatus Lambdaproteobacteria bacterium]
MAWEKIHQTKDDLVHTSRWEDEKGWYYKVEIGPPDRTRTARTVYVEDPLHAGKNARFQWRRHSDRIWAARVHGGELHRSGVGAAFKLKFAHGNAAQAQPGTRRRGQRTPSDP